MTFSLRASLYALALLLGLRADESVAHEPRLLLSISDIYMEIFLISLHLKINACPEAIAELEEILMYFLTRAVLNKHDLCAVSLSVKSFACRKDALSVYVCDSDERDALKPDGLILSFKNVAVFVQLSPGACQQLGYKYR